MFGKSLRQPEGQWQQYEGKAIAELQRGTGRCVLQPQACQLEPPYHPYDRQQLTPWDCVVNNWEANWGGSRAFNPDAPLILHHIELTNPDHLTYLAIEQFTDDEATIDKAVQLLLSLPRPRVPVAFELVGFGQLPKFDYEHAKKLAAAYQDGDYSEELLEAVRHPKVIGWTEPYTGVQLAAHHDDASILARQLAAHYPNSAVRELDTFDELLNPLPLGRDGYGCCLMLDTAYCLPLNVFSRLDTDPLGPAIAAMEHLEQDQFAVLQILFTPATCDWATNLQEAIRHPYKPNETLFPDLTARDLERKLASPLFAVAIRLMASTSPVYEQLVGWARQFAAPPQNLSPIYEDELDELSNMIKYRYTLNPGLLLNTEELASLVHLPAPSITSTRLRRVATRTKPAPAAAAEPGSVLLGDNVHRGTTTPARIAAELRSRHCYIAGASGTGKSTLIANMIKQDLEAGSGVGLLDPHGDLIDTVLSLIPEKRATHVAYFDPTDTEHPPAFNILAGHRSERQRIVSETVATIRRFYPDAWGPRLEHILRHALATIVKAKGASLLHLRRLLTDAAFRQQLTSQLKDDNLRAFWLNEFDQFPKGSVDPILNKISPFLLNATVRNIICQPHCSFDFDELMNGQKIFLANLSKGTLGDEAAGVFGTFIMSKLVTAAFRRDKIPEADRRPFYLYVDEFQNFMQLSLGFEQILAEARKYKLVLAGLANQYVGQLSMPVRQAIFGNVGTLLTFRLGTVDARLVAHEFGEFTPEEIMSLERGQAIARLGGTQTAFNLVTPPPPDKQAKTTRAKIVALSQRKHTTPRSKIEAAFRAAAKPATASPASDAPLHVVPFKKPTPQPASKPKPEFLPPDPADDAADFV